MDPVRVLLVEDDDDNRELMAEVLATAGFEVVSAASGRDALRSLAERSVDAIVTDVGMPGMGGLELAAAARKVAPSVPVIVVTGWAEREDISESKDVVAVLVKPVDPDVLAQAVADVARGRGRP
jgi:CheY-like chemotaxis protein